MVQSSIKWSQVDDVKGVLVWLENNALPNSILVTEERFYGWVQIYLERDKNDMSIVVYSHGGSPFSVMQNITGDEIYLIWYNTKPIPGFHQLFYKNEIAIFKHDNSL
jgi:hypothetical protein